MPLALPLTTAITALLMGLASLPAWSQATRPAAPRAAAPTAPAAPATDSKPASALDAELFYQLLLGELMLRDNDPGAAYSLIHEAARRTQEPELYRRAVDIALQGRAGNAALTAARDWARAYPQDDEPHRYVLQILLALNRAQELAPTLSALLQLTPPERRQEVIGAVPQTLARLNDTTAALEVASTALRPWLERADTAASAWSAMGRMQMALDRDQDALAAAQRGLAADPQATAPLQLALALMQRPARLGEALVLQRLQGATGTGTGTDSAALHLDYVRVLIDQQRLADAQREIARLSERAPQLPEPWLLLGSMQLQERRLDQAQASLERYLALSRESASGQPRAAQAQAFLMLSLVAEARRDWAAANSWLVRIEDGDALVTAQIRRATLLGRQGRLDDALATLASLPERNADERRRKGLAEAQLWRDLQRHTEALAAYGRLVERFPEDPDLAYEQAMAAERAGQVAEMERLLRQLMLRHPDYHHAYNALGYALADRNERLTEAKSLIQKALQAAPNDAYILDSLGWVEYRMGNLDEARRILQDAYRRQPDAEIAAHLGEVLWQLQQRQAALDIWREGLLLNPDNQTLAQTLRRFQVQP